MGAAICACLASLLLVLATSQAAPERQASASKAAPVVIRNFAFHPKTLEIAKGTKVAFSNSSEVPHTATRAGVFNTRRIPPGTSKVVQFQQKGTFPYHCKIHPFMQGKIVVG